MEWKCKDGTKIAIENMSTEHIQNSIKMLKRKNYIEYSKYDFYLGCSGPTGEMAQYAFDSEFDSIVSKVPSKILDALNTELAKRFKVGMKVTYKTEHKKEHGIIKSMSSDTCVFVVYNCAGEWNNYKNYTAARTNMCDLVEDWIE